MQITKCFSSSPERKRGQKKNHVNTDKRQVRSPWGKQLDPDHHTLHTPLNDPKDQREEEKKERGPLYLPEQWRQITRSGKYWKCLISMEWLLSFSLAVSDCLSGRLWKNRLQYVQCLTVLQTSPRLLPLIHNTLKGFSVEWIYCTILGWILKTYFYVLTF